MKMPKRLSHLSWKKLGDFTLILDSKGENQAHQLNEIGSIIWEYCDGEKTHEELITHLSSLYDTTSQQLSLDISLYIEELKNKKLLYET